MTCFRARVEGVCSSIGRGTQRFRGYEALEPTGLRVQFGPFVEGEIDDEKAGRRQFLAHLFTRFDVAGRDEHKGEFVQPGIMADNEQGVRIRRCLFDEVEDFMGRGAIQPLDGRSGRRRLECGSSELPGFPGPGRRRRHDPIRSKSMCRHISADAGRILAAAFDQLAASVFRAWFGAFGLGMAKKEKAAHGHAMDFGGRAGTV
jgi:hypothetical protein